MPRGLCAARREQPARHMEAGHGRVRHGGITVSPFIKLGLGQYSVGRLWERHKQQAPSVLYDIGPIGPVLPPQECGCQRRRWSGLHYTQYHDTAGALAWTQNICDRRHTVQVSESHRPEAVCRLMMATCRVVLEGCTVQ